MRMLRLVYLFSLLVFCSVGSFASSKLPSVKDLRSKGVTYEKLLPLIKQSSHKEVKVFLDELDRFGLKALSQSLRDRIVFVRAFVEKEEELENPSGFNVAYCVSNPSHLLKELSSFCGEFWKQDAIMLTEVVFNPDLGSKHLTGVYKYDRKQPAFIMSIRACSEAGFSSKASWGYSEDSLCNSLPLLTKSHFMEDRDSPVIFRRALLNARVENPTKLLEDFLLMNEKFQKVELYHYWEDTMLSMVFEDLYSCDPVYLHKFLRSENLAKIHDEDTRELFKLTASQYVRLWTPHVHLTFSQGKRDLVRAAILCHNRDGQKQSGILSALPKHVLFKILGFAI